MYKLLLAISAVCVISVGIISGSNSARVYDEGLATEWRKQCVINELNRLSENDAIRFCKERQEQIKRLDTRNWQ
jgi:hypothetical protein